MSQLFLQTLVIGATPFQSTSYNGARLNFSGAETAGVACVITIEGPDGQKTINVKANGTFIRQATETDRFTITGNGATVTLEISGPDPFEYTDPQTFTLVNGVTIIGNGGSDPVNPSHADPIPASPLILTYTVPAGMKLLLNSVVGTISKDAAAGTLTVTAAQITLTGAGGTAGVYLAKDATGGTLTPSKVYAIAAYEGNVTPGVTGDVAAFNQMLYPQTLGPGDVISLNATYTGVSTASALLNIQGVLSPL